MQSDCDTSNNQMLRYNRPIHLVGVLCLRRTKLSPSASAETCRRPCPSKRYAVSHRSLPRRSNWTPNLTACAMPRMRTHQSYNLIELERSSQPFSCLFPLALYMRLWHYRLYPSSLIICTSGISVLYVIVEKVDWQQIMSNTHCFATGHDAVQVRADNSAAALERPSHCLVVSLPNVTTKGARTLYLSLRLPRAAACNV